MKPLSPETVQSIDAAKRELAAVIEEIKASENLKRAIYGRIDALAQRRNELSRRVHALVMTTEEFSTNDLYGQF